MWRDVVCKADTRLSPRRLEFASHLKPSVTRRFLNLTKSFFGPKLYQSNIDIVRQDKKRGVRDFTHRPEMLKGSLILLAMDAKGYLGRQGRLSASVAGTKRVPCVSG